MVDKDMFELPSRKDLLNPEVSDAESITELNAEDVELVGEDPVAMVDQMIHETDQMKNTLLMLGARASACDREALRRTLEGVDSMVDFILSVRRDAAADLTPGAFNHAYPRGTPYDSFPGGGRGSALYVEAHKKINGERQRQYGDPEDSFAYIAARWCQYLNGRYLARYGVELSLRVADVAFMLADFKMARECFQSKLDNTVDATGYLGINHDARSSRKEQH